MSNEPETLNEFLNSYTVDTLKRLAALFGERAPTRKAELVEFIHARVMGEAALRQLWATLDQLQQAAVAEALYHPQLLYDAGHFRAKYGGDPDWGSRNRWSQLDKPARLGLFLHLGRLPVDVAAHLRAFVPPPAPAAINTAAELPDTITLTAFDYTGRAQRTWEEPLEVRHTERVAQRDLLAVLRLIDTGKVRASEKTQQVSAAGARTIAEILEGGDFYAAGGEADPGPMKAFAWPLLLQAANLAQLAGTKLQLTPAGKKALTAPPPETLRRIWQRWLKTRVLDEMSRVNAIRGQTGKGKRYLTAVAGRREQIVSALSASTPERWVAFTEFSRFVRAGGYTFEISRDLWTLYINSPGYGNLGYAGYGEWHILQGRYLLAFLFEYAATLGLLDVAYIHPRNIPSDYSDLWGVDDLDYLSRYDGLCYFRINGLGAWCLEHTATYTPTPFVERVVLEVLPNLDVAARELLPPADALFLQQVAEPVAEGLWRLTPEQLLLAVEQGQPIAEIRAFLSARSGALLPEAATSLLDDIAARAALLTYRGPALLIEVTDPLLAQLLAYDERLRDLCQLAGERYLVVTAAQEATFRRTLRELGYVLPPGG